MRDDNSKPGGNGRDEVFPRAAEVEPLDPAVEDEAEPVIEVEAEPVAIDEAAGRIQALEADLRDARERMLRIAADFDNYKKRNDRERQDFVKFASERLLRDLLPILDNLARAADSARRSGEAPAIVAGLDLVLQEMQKVLRRAGVEPVEAENQPFDPAFHEALQQVESDAHPPGTVVNEVQRGYTLHGRVLRPALVAVSTAPEETSPGFARPELPDGEEPQ